MRGKGWILTACLLACAPASGQSPGTSAELEQLRAENAVLRGELRQIKEAVVRVEGRLTAEPAPSADPSPLERVAVVDVGVLFRDYQRKDRMERAVNELREMYRSLLDEQQRWAAEERARVADAEERARVDARFEARKREVEERLKERVEAATLQLLDELEYGVALHARRAGLALVLKIDGGDPAWASALRSGHQERIYRAQIQDVLFQDGTLDRTGEVLALVNGDEFGRRIGSWEDAGGPALAAALCRAARRWGADVVATRAGSDLALEVTLTGKDLRVMAELRAALEADLHGRFERVDSSISLVDDVPPRLQARFRLVGWKPQAR